MHALALALALSLTAPPPPGEDLQPPAGALTGMASARLAAPVAIAFDVGINDDVTPLVKNDGSSRAGGTREVVWSLARFAPAIARRHFEDAKWTDPKATRSIVIKSASVTFRSGPFYEVKVEVDRYDGKKRLGQASGTGYGQGTRTTAQQTGGAYAAAFGVKVDNGATEADPAQDAAVIRAATLQALDSALMQLAAVWSGEQLMQKAREDAEAMMKKNSKTPAPKKK